MSEESERVGSGPEGNGAGVDPTAVALALAGASRAKADTFLDDQHVLIAKQCALADDQRHHLHEQLKQIHLDVWEKQLGVLLRLATIIVGIAVAVGAGVIVWQAAHSDGLRVDAFSVPPDLAARGLTGQVVAAKLIDRLDLLQSQTNTARPGRSYSNNWEADGIKLEIPDTGISFSELDSWMRQVLGNETHIGGEIVRTATGVAITARAGGDGAVTVSGSDGDMDTLVRQLGDSLYRLTQPYRYAIYLFRHEKRSADAVPIFRQLALHGSAEERRWSYTMWANATEIATGNRDIALHMYELAHAANPDASNPLPIMALELFRFGRWEESLQVTRDYLQNNGGNKAIAEAEIDVRGANYHDAEGAFAEDVRNPVPGYPSAVMIDPLIRSEIGLHDVSAARASLAEWGPSVAVDFDKRVLSVIIKIGAEDWRGIVADEDGIATYLKKDSPNRHEALVAFAPSLALAEAHRGDFAAAERTIAPTPSDCYPCLIARAQIAEMKGQRPRADFWFDRATHAGPSLPFAFEAKGKVLLRRGAPDQAIASFTIANQKSPHFADPLEGWGEALMAKNQSHLALAKFAEADKYAPNWGRLHLKWGEALVYAGRKDDAGAQFTRAAALNLTASEKSELATQPFWRP